MQKLTQKKNMAQLYVQINEQHLFVGGLIAFPLRPYSRLYVPAPFHRGRNLQAGIS